MIRAIIDMRIASTVVSPHPEQDSAVATGIVLGAVSAAGTWCVSIYALRAAAWGGLLSPTYRGAAPIRWTGWLARRLWENPALIPDWAAGALLVSSAAGAAVYLLVRHLGALPGENHLAGTWVEKLPKRGWRAGGDGVEVVPGLRLSQAEETHNILYLAGVGGGKTTGIMHLVRQARARGDRLLILDFKRDFTQALLAESDKPVTLIAPWDQRSARWQIGEDLSFMPPLNEFLVALIPDGREAIWAQGGRAIARVAIVSLIQERGTSWGWGDLLATCTAILNDTQALRGVAAAYAPEVLLTIDTAAGTRTSFTSNIGRALSQIAEIAGAESLIPRSRTWSVRQWREQPGACAILGWLPESPGMSRAILLPLIESAINGLLALPDAEPDEAGRRVWLILDEIGQVGNVPGLTSAFTSLRSRGGRIVAGIQSLSQIKKTFGPEEMSIWEGQIATKIFSRVQSREDQDAAAKMCGKQRIERFQRSFGRGSSGSSVNSNWVESERDTVRPDEFGRLGVRKNKTGVDEIILCDGRVYQAELLKKDLPSAVKKTSALIKTDYLKPGFLPAPATQLGHVVDLERFRRLAPPNPNDQGRQTPRRG
ncbi:MAG: type IV secretion system DNA-binding domain-containing protein [Acidiphilium sp.]